MWGEIGHKLCGINSLARDNYRYSNLSTLHNTYKYICLMSFPYATSPPSRSWVDIVDDLGDG